MALNAAGIGSGLDVNGLVEQLLSAERTPATARLDKEEKNAEVGSPGTELEFAL